MKLRRLQRKGKEVAGVDTDGKEKNFEKSMTGFLFEGCTCYPVLSGILEKLKYQCV